MWKTIRNIWNIVELRNKLLYTTAFLFVYRMGFFVPIPGVDTVELGRQQDQGGDYSGFMNLINLVSGGALTRCSAFSLGIMPYISASIIFSLLAKVIPRLEEISKEGDSGRRRIGQYTRYATLVLCVFQSFFVIQLITGSAITNSEVSLYDTSMGEGLFTLVAVVTMTTGTMFLVWLGEQISEYGIGNGASIIIMAGILARMPSSLINLIAGGGTFADVAASSDALFKLVMFMGLFVVVVAIVVLITLGQRRIPIQNPKIARGRKVYAGERRAIPLRVNNSGVMPVIFASSLMIFPAMLFNKLSAWASSPDISLGGLANVLSFLGSALTTGSFFWAILYIIAVVFFAYFWNQLTFNPDDLSRRLKEGGAFIPGVRPGRKTAEYLHDIMVRITLVGSVFLCFIALFPTFVAGMLNMDYMLASFLGGTSLLILVGVALDLVQKVEAHLLVRDYAGFGEAGKGTKGRR